MTIGERLREIMAARHDTIRSFSVSSGIPYRTLQEYLADKRGPGADHLAKIARQGINLNWLLTGESIEGYSSEYKNINIDNNKILHKLICAPPLFQKAADLIIDWAKSAGSSQLSKVRLMALGIEITESSQDIAKIIEERASGIGQQLNLPEEAVAVMFLVAVLHVMEKRFMARSAT